MQITPPRHPSTDSPRIVARRENVPPKLSGKNEHRKSRAPKIWVDADHWNQLAAIYLPRHDLPRWDAPCEPEAMHQWLDRLGMKATEYRQLTHTGIADFCELNPTWPLRVWIGTVLEMVYEKREA